MAVQVMGTTPAGNKPRVVELTREDDKLRVWVHAPDSDDQAGWEAVVSTADLLKAIGAALES